MTATQAGRSAVSPRTAAALAPSAPSHYLRRIARLIRQALACVPPDVDRETWVRLAMAIKSELGADGFDLWDGWSQQAQGYRAADARDTWRSIKAGGRVTVGTLFGIAKEYGFRFPDAGQAVGGGRPAPANDDAHQRLAQAKRQEREAEEAAYRARADQAAREAQAQWDAAADQGASAYLERKRVQAHGVRFLADGTLLVPMRDGAGLLQNLQRIAPAKPTPEQEARGLREKRFLPGGRKTGLLHWLGDPQGAPVLAFAEGYATAATVHEAAGLPVAVCFDAGNLVHVVKAMRLLYPAAAFLICGDDDQATAQRTGKNPGREKATSAARAAASDTAPARAVFPAGLDALGSDFNDLAQAQGLEAVAALVNPAAEALAAGMATPDPRRHEADERPQPSAEAAPASAAQRGPKTAAQQGAAPAVARDPADPFFVADGNGQHTAGIYFVARDAEGNERKPEWVCAPLHVTARTRTEGAEAWGYLLEFTDPDGNAKTWAMPAQMLAGEGSEWAGYLRAMGLQMAPGTKARNLLARYVDTRRVQARAICTDRVGWHGGIYVLPSSSIGQAEGLRYVFQSEGGIDDQYKQRGELDAWRREVAMLAAGNTRLIFALCCAFAGPLLRLAGVESGGFQFRGDSSGGKTTALKVAASVFGPPGYMQRWRTTDNALEATAVQHSDSLLILDEFGQLDPKVAGECAYMLANEQEKGRATRGGLAKRRRTWRLLFLSSGELGLGDHMRQAGKEMRAGQEVRFVDIPLDAGAGMGGLECLHGFDSAQALAEGITQRAAQHYGTAGRAWVEWLADRWAALPDELGGLIEQHKGAMVPDSAAQQVFRVGNRFAVVAVAGELATQAGITGWQAGEAAAAVRTCFNAWLGARGHMDNGEEAAMLRQVKAWLEKNGDALFTWSHRALDDHRGNTPYRAGFKRLVDENGKPLKFDAATDYIERRSAAESSERLSASIEYMVLPEAFRQDVAKGFDSGAVAALLKRRGHLIHEKDRATSKQRLPGIGLAPVYHIRPSIFSYEL
jgi:putative DNA primase/helicase